jgi:hypothetical protein
MKRYELCRMYKQVSKIYKITDLGTSIQMLYKNALELKISNGFCLVLIRKEYCS